MINMMGILYLKYISFYRYILFHLKVVSLSIVHPSVLSRLQYLIILLAQKQ